MASWKGAMEGVEIAQVPFIQPSFWQGRRVLLTGHTGFKGAWLALWLRRLGAELTGVALPPHTSPSLFELAGSIRDIDSRFCDIRDAEALREIVCSARPEIIFHLAAQPLVRASYRSPLETFAVNVMGTANLLDALRSWDDACRVVIMVTTDKVYANHEWPWPYREDDPLGGHDPYSASKAASELVIDSYRKAFLADQGTAVASVRAGNVIGGGDWSEDRLIPDAVRAWERGQPLHVRYPEAIRPWQHVLEPLDGYLALAQRLWTDPSFVGAYNFGPATGEAATVREMVEQARAAYGTGEVVWDDGCNGPHEAALLTLEIAKVRAVLGFEPRWSIGEAVRRTMEWYRVLRDGADARSLCEAEFDAYEVLQ